MTFPINEHKILGKVQIRNTAFLFGAMKLKISACANKGNLHFGVDVWSLILSLNCLVLNNWKLGWSWTLRKQKEYTVERRLSGQVGTEANPDNGKSG